MTETKTYSAKSAAVRAAKAALGDDAIAGIDFNVSAPDGKRWVWAAIPQTSGAVHVVPADSEVRLSKAAAAEIAQRESGQMPEGVAAAGLSEAMGGPLAQEGAAADHAKVETPKVKEKTKRKSAKFAAMEEAAERGELPPEPDFSAETHKRFRPKLAQVVAMAQAGDLKGLKAFSIPAISTSPKAIMRYRDFAILALRARARLATEATKA